MKTILRNHIAALLLGLAVSFIPCTTFAENEISPVYQTADEAACDKDIACMQELLRRYKQDSKHQQNIELSQQNRLLWVVLGELLAALVIVVFLLLHLKRSRAEINALNAGLEQRVETLLNKREAEFRALIENAPDPIFRFGRDCRLLYVNPAAERSCGKPAFRLLSKTPVEALTDYPAEIEKMQQSIAQVLATGRADEIETRFIAADGGDVYFQQVLVPEFAADGSMESVLSIGRDITARKRIEEVLFSSERKYRTLAENSPENIIRYDRECRVLYLNRNLRDTLGIAADECLGKTPSELPWPARSADYEFALRRVMERGVSEDYYLTLPDTGKGERYHHILMTPERNERDEVVGVLAIGRDITELKLMEQQLRLKEFVLDHAREAVYLMDIADLSLVYVNEEACRALGYSREELLGLSLKEIDLDLTPEEGKALWAKILANGAHTFETRHRRHDGSFFSVEVQGSMVEYEGRMFSLSMVRDITERKRMEDELRAREREFRSLAGNLPDNVARWDVEGRYLYVNPVHEHSLGVAAGTLIGTEIHEAGKASIARVVASGQGETISRCLLTVDGTTRIHDLILAPERDDEGRIISVLGIGRDMTELYRVQDEIAARERELRALAESSPGMMGAFYARPDGSICMPYVSAKIWEQFGLHPQDVRDDAAPLLARTHPDDAAMVGESIAESARSMTTWHAQYRIIHPERGELWMESHTNPEPHPDGGVVWYGYVHDITGRKQAERELDDLHIQLRGLIAQREAAREDERKHIARELHDELGQLMTALRLNVQMLAGKIGDSAPSLREHLRETVSVVNEAQSVVRNLSKSLRPVELDMGIVRALEWAVKRFETFTNIGCRLHIGHPDIKPDELREIALFRIAQESFTNIAKHAQATAVEVSLCEDANDYVLKIRDNGKGFDTSEKKANSFGLVGIRERALMLGGTVSIDSGHGTGTEIVVRIPKGEEQ